ncbi:hypothetical protein [Natrinema caseinilyticum]|uniref:hypothetical protein n=1 Tax=Natrinema caseinilyticum TaxID=2961570 RepID=UPI0020C41556|nr:hypothetical protein [Natrinema caseinilyticum]
MTKGTTSVEFEGPHSLQRAKDVLSSYDLGKVERISIEVEETFEDETKSSDESSGESKDDDDRELKQIQPNTNHHKVLSAVKRLEDDGAVSGNEVYEKSEDIKEGSAFASLSKLYQRRLLDRERVNDGSGSHYVYEITNYGEAEIDRIGLC